MEEDEREMMGCDIHLHTEVKIEGRWHHWQLEDVSRNYRLFEVMAGVRGDASEAVALPRGLPDDITVVTRKSREQYGEDGHSESWLTLDEMLEVYKRWPLPEPVIESRALWRDRYIFGMRPEGYREFPDEAPEFVEEIRYVFWFDN